MSSAWRNYFSYNQYTQIAARAVRASLKETHRADAEKRGLTTLRYQKWENGVGSEQVLLNPEQDKADAKKKTMAV